MPNKRVSDPDKQRKPLVTEDDRRDQEARLGRAIKHLWEKSKLRFVYESPPIQQAHKELLFLIDNAEPETVATWYGQQILGISGLDAMDFKGETDLGVNRLPAPALTTSERRTMDAIVSWILDTANAKLFEVEYPRENRHYRILVAHLLSWPLEIHDPHQLFPPFPWPWLVQEEPGARPFVRAQRAATQRQARIAIKLNDVLRNLGRPVERMPYATLPKTNKEAENESKTKNKRAMSSTRRSVAELAYNQRKLNYTYSEILRSKAFEDAQINAGTGINSVPGLHKLLQELYGDTGWSDPKPRKR